MTHNQIDYWKMRNEKINNEQKNAETKRYNLVQEQLKRIDQDLQRDLMAINAKYKEKELDLASEELEWKRRYQATQLRLEQSRVDQLAHQNAINQMAVLETKRANQAREAETKRSNLAQETVALGKFQLEQALQPYTKSKMWSETQVDNARTGLIEKQTVTESTKPAQNMSQAFNNIISPFINLAGGVLRAVR